MKLSEIQDLIKFVAKSGVNEVELQTKDVKIVIRTKSGNGKEQQFIQAAPAALPVAPPFLFQLLRLLVIKNLKTVHLIPLRILPLNRQ